MQLDKAVKAKSELRQQLEHLKKEEEVLIMEKEMSLQQVAGKKEIRDSLFNIMNKLAEEKSVLWE